MIGPAILLALVLVNLKDMRPLTQEVLKVVPIGIAMALATLLPLPVSS